jgi:prepilin-type N-terminal cleavage/methylation domain-containing protein
MNKKTGFSLIELMLTLAIVAAMSVVAFMTYSYVSERMIVKKEADFSYDIVTTTRSLFNNTALKADSLPYGLNDVVMSELKNSNPYYAKKFENMSNMQTPFLEYVTIALASPEGGYGDRRPGQFVYVPQYPQKGMYSVSRCLKLANDYMGN